MLRPRLLLQFSFLLVALSLCGCSSNNKGKIEGTKWTSIATSVKGQQVPAGALHLTFASDGKLTYKAGPMTFTGTYSLGMMDYVTLNLDQELSGRKSHTERIQINNNTLTMIDSDGTQVSFTKDAN